MDADTVISALSENGYISIRNSNLYANDSIVFGSVNGGAFMGNDSTFTTRRITIYAAGNASMNTAGNAQVRQNSDGSISFHTGEN